MARKGSENMTTTRDAPPMDAAGAELMPVTIVAVGRQRVGKTTLLNAMAQYYRKRGANLQVWNADHQNTTNNLTAFHGDTVSAPSGSMSDVVDWLEERIRDQTRHRYDVILDVGGGETALNRLVQELRLVEALERRKIRVVGIHLLGPDPADLDYLRRFMESRTFMPKATLMVMNEGLITSGNSSAVAFQEVMAHPAMTAALGAGAETVIMPSLSCMGEVTKRGLTFEDMSNDVQVEGHEDTSFFDQERTALWWEKEMPAFFGRIPAAWMPRIPAPGKVA